MAERMNPIEHIIRIANYFFNTDERARKDYDYFESMMMRFIAPEWYQKEFSSVNHVHDQCLFAEWLQHLWKISLIQQIK